MSALYELSGWVLDLNQFFCCNFYYIIVADGNDKAFFELPPQIC
jgi:hypothetical protein